MKAEANTKRVLVSMPFDVRQWLEGRARYHGGTMTAEVVRSVRERMERERESGGKVAASE